MKVGVMERLGCALAWMLLVSAWPVFAQSVGGTGGVVSPMCYPCGPGEINLPPTVSLTGPANGQVFTVGQAVTLSATASDSDGGVASVVFTVDGVAVATATAEPYSAIWTATAGSHAVRAKATDDGGKSITSSPVTITVNGPAPPPVQTPLPPVAGMVSRTEAIVYHDNTTKWVLGQTASVTCMASVPASTSCDGDDVMSQTTYDPTTALPTASYAFGKLQSSTTYYADGTVNTVKDGRNNTTTLSSWKRGIPQSIQYADGTSQSAVVNDNGWIDSVTDENGFSTAYTYDAMGRLSGIIYATGDTTAWANTTRSFVSVASAEYGIAAGHWRLTETTGNAVKITYFDGMWRPLLVREYDAANVAGTERFTRTAYDAEGRVSFQSYPSASSAPNTGIWTDYDSLGRVTSVSQDSELGVLVTTTEYLTGFQTRTTNPRGYQTVSSYLAYDQPSTDWPVTVSAPEGQVTTISRDPYGKPTQLSRGGITRSYAYNGYQELCRSVEPETGATLFGYDPAGNLSWSAAGLPSSQACSSTGAEAAIVARKASRTYDARNRLSTLAFPDGNGNQTWTYTNDGLPYSIATSNGGSTVGNVYNYNKRRLLISEGLTPDTLQSGWGIGYGYNSLGQRITETTPDNVILTYSVNALGQATGLTASVAGGAATTLASGASYYPNGAVKQFTYGNGIVHTMTQNARQLPSQSTDCALAGTCAVVNRKLDLTFGFDANGNVTAITDGTTAGRQTRSMGYDGLDRLTSTSSLMFGTAGYAYDTADNLAQVTVSGGSQPRTHYYCYNASTNRLDFVRTGPSCSTSPAAIALAYDVQGNLSVKNGASYAFDFGNRLRNTAGLTYRYDGLGRRVRQDSAGGQLKYSVYAQDGRVLWQRDEVAGKRINNAYFAGSLLAEVSRPLASDTVTLSYFHTDALGSPIAKSNASGAITETSEYEPYGLLLNRANDDRVGYTGHVMDSASGLTYMQQRYYDPACGCFLSVDPVTAYGGNLRHFNRYAYAYNNPYRFTDPDGRAGCDVCKQLVNQAKGALVGYAVKTAVAFGKAMFAEGKAGLESKAREARNFLSQRDVTVTVGGSGMVGAPFVGNSVAGPGTTIVADAGVVVNLSSGQVGLQGNIGAVPSLGGGAVASGNFAIGFNNGPLQSGISTTNTAFAQATAVTASGTPVDVGGAVQWSGDGGSVSVGFKPGVGTYMGTGGGPLITGTLVTPPIREEEKKTE